MNVSNKIKYLLIITYILYSQNIRAQYILNDNKSPNTDYFVNFEVNYHTGQNVYLQKFIENILILADQGKITLYDPILNTKIDTLDWKRRQYYKNCITEEEWNLLLAQDEIFEPYQEIYHVNFSDVILNFEYIVRIINGKVDYTPNRIYLSINKPYHYSNTDKNYLMISLDAKEILNSRDIENGFKWKLPLNNSVELSCTDLIAKTKFYPNSITLNNNTNETIYQTNDYKLVFDSINVNKSFYAATKLIVNSHLNSATFFYKEGSIAAGSKFILGFTPLDTSTTNELENILILKKAIGEYILNGGKVYEYGNALLVNHDGIYKVKDSYVKPDLLIYINSNFDGKKFKLENIENIHFKLYNNDIENEHTGLYLKFEDLEFFINSTSKKYKPLSPAIISDMKKNGLSNFTMKEIIDCNGYSNWIENDSKFLPNYLKELYKAYYQK